MTRVIRPPAALEPRTGDEVLTVEQVVRLSLFADVNVQQLKLEEFPGTILLRHFDKGEVLCYQDDPGYTAFYPLTIKDLRELRQAQLETRPNAGEPTAALAARWRKDVAELEHLEKESGPRIVARAFKALPASEATGVLDAVRRWRGQAGQSPAGPGAPIAEGQLFGEMSCLYRIPRTATVVAERDGYMLELLRNIFDKINTKKFKDQVNELYRKRVLELHLRALPLFKDLSADDYARLCGQAKLVEFEPGEVICDEHDRADSMFVIRYGFVEVRKGATILLSADEVLDWSALCTALQAGGQEAAGPRRKVWQTIPEAARQTATRGAAGESLSRHDQEEIVCALNDLLKQPKLHATAELAEVVKVQGWAAEAKALPASAKKWEPYRQVCRFNRRLLATLYPKVLVPPGPTSGTGRILGYSSEGDLIGEIGLLRNQPRSATCVAYDHPQTDKKWLGRVEMVRIDKELFDALCRSSGGVEGTVAAVAQEREANTAAEMSRPVWQESSIPARSRSFAELGLIQGQKLMLIDLDRCTRCDKCVEACVESHSKPWWSGLLPWLGGKGPTDGRSRLFLEGPRFQVQEGDRVKNYLVPATCRMCKDPVCLIGCPVGSIHKGTHGQIVIENWCIGCTKCAEQCPYGAIQMHAVGLVPQGSRDWGWAPGPDGPWQPTQTPWRYDRDARERWSDLQEVHLRREFLLSAKVAAESKSYQVNIQSASAALTMHLNGAAVSLRTVKVSGKNWWNLEALLALQTAAVPEGLTPGETPPARVLRVGQNVLTIQVATTSNDLDVLLELGLCALSRPVVPPEMGEGSRPELVMNTAVVCDMCSESFGQRPACVNACPHDAAMRLHVQDDPLFGLFGERGA